MSTRRERADRWWLRCLNCGARGVRHFDVWTKTYTCANSCIAYREHGLDCALPDGHSGDHVARRIP